MANQAYKMYLNSNHNDVGMVYNIAAAAVITIIGYIIMMLLSVILGESNMYNVIITVLVFIVAFKSTQDLGYRRRVKGPSSRVLNPDLNNSPDSDTESDEGNSSDEEESDREPDQQNVEGFAWVKEREGSVIYSRQYKPVVPVGYWHKYFSKMEKLENIIGMYYNWQYILADCTMRQLYYLESLLLSMLDEIQYAKLRFLWRKSGQLLKSTKISYKQTTVTGDIAEKVGFANRSCRCRVIQLTGFYPTEQGREEFFSFNRYERGDIQLYKIAINKEKSQWWYCLVQHPVYGTNSKTQERFIYNWYINQLGDFGFVLLKKGIKPNIRVSTSD